MFALRLVAIAAINGPISSWLERHERLTAAAGAGRAIHLARLARGAATPAAIATAAHLSFACGAARGTTAGGVVQSTLCEEFLLAHTEGERGVAVAAIQRLVTKCHGSFFLTVFSSGFL